MKSFSAFLNEVQYIPTKNREEGLKITGKLQSLPAHFLTMKGVKHVSTTTDGHHVYRYNEGGSYCTHYFLHPKHVEQMKKSKDPNFSVSPALAIVSKFKRHKNGSETHEIHNLIGGDKRTIRPEDAYHHLIKHHDYIMKGHLHNKRSKKLWQDLQTKHSKDVDFSGWNDETGAHPSHGGKTIPAHSTDRTPADPHSSIYGGGKRPSNWKAPGSRPDTLLAFRKAKR